MSDRQRATCEEAIVASRDEPLLLAIDPGETTGYAVLRLEPLVNSQHMPVLLEHGVLSKWRGITELLNVYRPKVIVMEKFLLYPWAAKEQAFSDMAPVQVIGVVEYLAEERALPVIQQAAAVGKAVKVSSDLDLRSAVRSRHAIDAVCHGIAYLRSLHRKEVIHRKQREMDDDEGQRSN